MKLLITFLILIATSVSQAQMTFGIKNFRSYIAALSRVLKIDVRQQSRIQQYYAQNSSRLPKHGEATELSGPVLMTYMGLAGIFCQIYCNNGGLILGDTAYFKEKLFEEPFTMNKRKELIQGYANLFLQRDPTELETQNILAAMEMFVPGSQTVVNGNLLQVPCVIYAVSPEFLRN